MKKTLFFASLISTAIAILFPLPIELGRALSMIFGFLTGWFFVEWMKERKKEKNN